MTEATTAAREPKRVEPGAQPGAADGSGAPKVFISYARKDSAFTDALEVGLRRAGIEPFIDRSDIEKFADWWERIKDLIGRADTVIFVLSPNSVNSPICAQEVEYAAELHKRLAPVVHRPIDGLVVPPALARLNYIYFDGPDRSQPALDELVKALNTDIDWVRQHTSIGEQALRWQARSQAAPAKAEPLLLRGNALGEAEIWISKRPRDAPEPTPLHRSFILESRRSEQARLERERQQVIRMQRTQRRLTWALIAAGLLVLLGLLAVSRTAIETSRREAVVFARESLAQFERGYCDRAIRLAVAGLPPPGGALFKPQSRELGAALLRYAANCPLQHQISGHGGSVTGAEFSPDGQILLTASTDATARLWRADTGALIAELAEHTGELRSAHFNADASRVVTASDDKTARLWDARSGALIATLTGHAKEVRAAVFSPDGAVYRHRLERQDGPAVGRTHRSVPARAQRARG